MTGQDVLALDHPQPITNPYDLWVSEDGTALVTDSGRNSLLAITPEGDVVDFRVFEPIEFAGEVVDAVPTGIVQGPDEAWYITTLTGWPHPTPVPAAGSPADHTGPDWAGRARGSGNGSASRT